MSTNSLIDENVSEEDIVYEEDITRNPYHLRSWLIYLEAKRKKLLDISASSSVSGSKIFKDKTPSPEREKLLKEINHIYERALAVLPRSYKLWNAYLNERVFQTRAKSLAESE